jgi:hypothetical protein
VLVVTEEDEDEDEEDEDEDEEKDEEDDDDDGEEFVLESSSEDNDTVPVTSALPKESSSVSGINIQPSSSVEGRKDRGSNRYFVPEGTTIKCFACGEVIRHGPSLS